jgi:hypothetical protein
MKPSLWGDGGAKGESTSTLEDGLWGSLRGRGDRVDLGARGVGQAAVSGQRGSAALRPGSGGGAGYRATAGGCLRPRRPEPARPGIATTAGPLAGASRAGHEAGRCDPGDGAGGNVALARHRAYRPGRRAARLRGQDGASFHPPRMPGGPVETCASIVLVPPAKPLRRRHPRGATRPLFRSLSMYWAPREPPATRCEWSPPP